MLGSLRKRNYHFWRFLCHMHITNSQTTEYDTPRKSFNLNFNVIPARGAHTHTNERDEQRNRELFDCKRSVSILFFFPIPHKVFISVKLYLLCVFAYTNCARCIICAEIKRREWNGYAALCKLKTVEEWHDKNALCTQAPRMMKKKKKWQRQIAKPERN